MRVRLRARQGGTHAEAPSLCRPAPELNAILILSPHRTHGLQPAVCACIIPCTAPCPPSSAPQVPSGLRLRGGDARVPLGRVLDPPAGPRAQRHRHGARWGVPGVWQVERGMEQGGVHHRWAAARCCTALSRSSESPLRWHCSPSYPPCVAVDEDNRGHHLADVAYELQQVWLKPGPRQGCMDGHEVVCMQGQVAKRYLPPSPRLAGRLAGLEAGPGGRQAGGLQPAARHGAGARGARGCVEGRRPRARPHSKPWPAPAAPSSSAASLP